MILKSASKEQCVHSLFCSLFITKRNQLQSLFVVEDFIMPTTVRLILNHLDSVLVLAAGFYTTTAFYMTVVEAPAMGKLSANEHWRCFFFEHV